MLDSQTLKLTRAFYEWELRGRGWTRYPHRVALEPAFEAFAGHDVSAEEPNDDGRHHSWLSAFVERFREPVLYKDSLPEETEEAPRGSASEAEDPGDYAEFLIASPPGSRISQTAVESWLETLSVSREPTAVELVGGGRRVEVRVVAALSDAPHAVSQLEAALPGTGLARAAETLAARWRSTSGTALALLELGLAREFMVPLAAGARPKDESLLAIVAALAEIGSDELGVVQVLFEPVTHPWRMSILRAVTTNGGAPFFADAPELTSLARLKAGSPLFAAALRIAGIAGTESRAEEIVRRIAAGFSQFGSPNGNEFMPLPNNDPAALEGDILGRTTHRAGMLLSLEELATLIKFPGSGVLLPELYRGEGKSKAAPEESLSGSGCFLGLNSHGSETHEIRLTAETRAKHVHVIGGSGTGKSTLLARMILEDIEAGHGVGVLDPHGDLIDEIASRVPEVRAADVVYFDPTDDQATTGWNVLGAESDFEKDLLAADIVGVFQRLSTSWGDQMTAVLANAVMVFLESIRGGTLEDLRRFLVDDRFRKEFLATAPDSYAASFWTTDFPLLVGRKPQAPILTRLDIFLRSALVRRVVTVREPKLDFRAVTDGGLIFLGKLAAGAIGEENAALLGSLLVSKFHQVTLARQGQRVEDRRPFFLYIDEFHHVATPSMASLFSGMRKYRLGLTVAHQDLYQLHQSVQEVERSLLANAYTRVCFRLGEEDARQLARGFAAFEPEDFMRLGVGEAICRVGSREGDFNLRVRELDAQNPDEARDRVDRLRALSRARWSSPSTPKAEITTKPRIDGAALPAIAREGEAAPRAVAPPAAAATRASEASSAPSSLDSARHRDLDKETLDYLESVALEPFLSVRKRNQSLGLSSWKGNRAKAALIENDLVREVAVNPGARGSRFKLLELTSEGREFLSSLGVKRPSGHGRGGIAHQWWAKTIASWLESLDVSPTIEDDSAGVRVDLSFSVRGQEVAVEIEMGTDHALENIRKDMAAGFKTVVCLLDNPEDVTRMSQDVSGAFGAAPPEVLLGALRDFEKELAPLLSSRPTSLRGPNQNKEPRPAAPRVPRERATSLRSMSVAADFSQPGAFTTPVAAEYLGLSPATLETMRSRGGGPVFVKLGARVVYRREELDEWLASHRKTSTSAPDSESG
jgi:predicted DNA-binding transcriptional regulator AlpA